jgi:hypothetical protein
LTARRIAGSVVDAHDNPLAGARVFFTSGPGPLPDIAAVTRSDGRFELTAPVPGVYTIAAATESAEMSTAEVVVDGDVDDLVLRMP